MASSGIPNSREDDLRREFTAASDFSRVFLLPAKSSTATNRTIRGSQFNPDLTLLKSFRNADKIPYSHWGGTDHEELRNPHQRRGSGSSILRTAPLLSLSLPHALSSLDYPPVCPVP